MILDYTVGYRCIKLPSYVVCYNFPIQNLELSF